jgi:hypothetical protein
MKSTLRPARNSKNTLVWEWATPLLLILLSVALVEVGHAALAWWRWGLVSLGWVVLGAIYVGLWHRWRSCEIDRIRHEKLPRGHLPRITLLAGEDLDCGQDVVVNDRGFVVAPERPFPPPGSPTRFVGRVDDASDLELDVDGLSGP